MQGYIYASISIMIVVIGVVLILQVYPREIKTSDDALQFMCSKFKICYHDQVFFVFLKYNDTHYSEYHADPNTKMITGNYSSSFFNSTSGEKPSGIFVWEVWVGCEWRSAVCEVYYIDEKNGQVIGKTTFDTALLR